MAIKHLVIENTLKLSIKVNYKLFLRHKRQNESIFLPIGVQKV